MPEEIRLWVVGNNGSLGEVKRGQLDLEKRIEDWLAADISILSRDLMVIGRQVPTTFGGYVDLLCLDQGGDLVVVELKRDKTPREITAQVLFFAQRLRRENAHVTNIVFMGMGEPMLNLDAVWQSVLNLNDRQGLALGIRRFTISTVGIVPGIERLAREGLAVGLVMASRFFIFT